MFTRSRSYLRPLGGALSLVMMMTIALHQGRAASAGATMGSLTGRLYAADGKAPLVGAVLHLRNVTTQDEFDSPATGPDGSYKFFFLPDGHYAVGVVADGTDYNFESGVAIKSGKTAKVSLKLSPATGTDDSRKAVAYAPAKGRWAFFHSAPGVVMLAGGSAAIIAAVVVSQNNEPVSTPAK